MAALWRAYQRLLAQHPWKVQILTAGPRGGGLVPAPGSTDPGKQQDGGFEEDDAGPGGVCTWLPRLLLGHRRGGQWSVCRGELGQDPTGLPGRSAHQLLPLASRADGQLLLHPPELQAGRGTGRRCCLELLPLLEGQRAVRQPLAAPPNGRGAAPRHASQRPWGSPSPRPPMAVGQPLATPPNGRGAAPHCAPCHTLL
ncbi:mitochondrial inner membrane protein Mpv17 isoform X2 [Carettochelys insculpta]|uniref:mitochondrial inner membrane protein Mpv17 isoform X2 n=1 Tax=Carettochelys insculpta TaxID=44489 RepID=UPI003EBC82A5